MDKIELRNKLTESLAQMYEMEAIGDLAEFLQGELHVLQFMSSNKNMEINPSILSDMLHVSRPRITAALSALRKKGFVTMEISDEDRRRMKVMLTQNGEDLLGKKRENIEKYFNILVDGLGEKNVIDLIRLIDLSSQTMNKALIEHPENFTTHSRMKNGRK
ncbi:MAG: MarR family winged helix-turn-helix transcriptional regulator [Saccharofermentanales bacterium]